MYLKKVRTGNQQKKLCSKISFLLASWRSMTKIAGSGSGIWIRGSGSTLKCHVSATLVLANQVHIRRVPRHAVHHKIPLGRVQAARIAVIHHRHPSRPSAPFARSPPPSPTLLPNCRTSCCGPLAGPPRPGVQQTIRPDGPAHRLKTGLSRWHLKGAVLPTAAVLHLSEGRKIREPNLLPAGLLHWAQITK